MDFTQKLQAYVSATTSHAKKQLQGWFNLDILGLSDLALATFYFLYRAIDDNENKRLGEEAEDYLLVLPDAALEEEALYGALLGAILGKYRANYMDATRTTTEYSIGDILLSAKKNGEYQLWQVESGLKNDEI